MRPLILLLSLLLAGTAGAAEPFERTFHARVAVTAAGAVEAVEPQADLPAVVAKLVHDAASGLRFEPATVLGQPAASRTTVLVHARFEPGTGDALAARVLSVTEAQPTMPPPRYPMESLRAGINALVWLRIAVAADGAVDLANSAVESIDTRYSSGRKLGRAREGEPLAKAALAAAANWLVYPEEVAGVARATELRVPVTFCYPPDSKACRQFGEQRAAPTRSARDPEVRLAQLKPAAAGSGS